MGLRREVYLPMAAAVPAMLDLLGTLATSENPDLEPYRKLSEVSAKLSVVAETETAILITRASGRLIAEYMLLSIHAQAARAAFADAQRHKVYRTEALEKANMVQSKVDELLQSAVVGPEEVAHLGALSRILG